MTHTNSAIAELSSPGSRKSLPPLRTIGYDDRRYPRQVPKERKHQAEVVGVLQDNLQACFDYASKHPELTDRATAQRLAEWINEQKWGDRVGKTTLYKMANGTGPVVIDVLELIARAFELQAWHMLVPGLDPANPPHLIVTEQEMELWQSLKKYREGARETESSQEPEDAGPHSHREGDAPGETDDAGARIGKKRRNHHARAATQDKIAR